MTGDFANSTGTSETTGKEVYDLIGKIRFTLLSTR